MRITALIMMLMFTAIVVDSEAHADDRYVAEVQESGVNYIYSSNGKLTFIKTEATAELIEALVAKAPENVDVNVVTYVSHGRAGWELCGAEGCPEDE